MVDKGNEVKDGEDDGSRQRRIVEVYGLTHFEKKEERLGFTVEAIYTNVLARFEVSIEGSCSKNHFIFHPLKLYIFSLYQ